MNYRAKIGIATILISILGAFLFFQSNAASKPDLPNWTVFDVGAKTLLKELAYRGEVSLLNDKSIASHVTGKVQRVSVKLGQKVKRGEVLLEFDRNSASAHLQQLHANGKTTEIWLQELYPVLLRARVLELDKKKEELNKITVEHQAKVFAITEGIQLGITTDSQLQAALKAQATAVREIQIQTSGKELQISELKQQYSEAEAKLANVRSEANILKESLSSLKVQAPFDGTVVGMSTKINSSNDGTDVNIKDYLLTLTNLDLVGVTVKVAPQELNQLAVIKKAVCRNLVTLRTSDCKLKSVESNAADHKSFTATFVPSGGKPEWALGAKINVLVRLSEKNAEKTVPIKALTNQNDVTGVMVEKSGLLQFRPVTTGFFDGDFIEIIEGLSPGEKVMIP